MLWEDDFSSLVEEFIVDVWNIIIIIITQCTCICIYSSVPLGESVELSNGHLKLLFNESGHLTSWTDLVTSVSYSLQHEYLQEVEKAGLIEVDVCTGTSVYTFVPDDGSHVLTPKVIVIKFFIVVNP